MDINIDSLLEGGEEATEFNRVTKEIIESEANRLRGIPKQWRNWNEISNKIVGCE